jgi:hypothetical protein
VVHDAGDVEQPYAVGRGGFEDDVRLIQIEGAPLAAHDQLGIDEEVDSASPIRREIDVGPAPFNEREPRVPVSIPATATKKAARVSRPFESGIGGAGRGSVWANARGAKASTNAEARSRPFMSSAKQRSRIITVPVVEAVLRRRESADDVPANHSR